jgi:N-acetylmuramoyl-L-alanine amidase
MRIVISSGHGLYVRGASGFIDEVDEARRVVPRVAEYLREHGHQVVEFHDNTSTSQNENLETIVNAHNRETRDLDVSVHFNAYVPIQGSRGTEVLYVTQEDLAGRVSAAIADAGHLINRGAHYRSDLYFLNQTEMPAILIETCFVDATEDAKNYQLHFDAICQAIADVAATEVPPIPPRPERPPIERPPTEPTPPSDALAHFTGKVSWFGGPDDNGVSPSEGLAFFDEFDDAPHLFLDTAPPGTSGLARRLNVATYYVACRWDYDVTPKTMLADKTKLALVRANGREFLAWPADWGPHQDTDRVGDISPGLMTALQITTDDEAEVIYPAP